MADYRKLMGTKTEGQLEKETIKHLEAVGCYVRKFKSPSQRGVPDDIIVCKFGAVIFAEFKSPTGLGKVSPLQQIEIGKLKRNKAEVWIVRCADEAIELIERCANA